MGNITFDSTVSSQSSLNLKNSFSSSKHNGSSELKLKKIRKSAAFKQSKSHIQYKKIYSENDCSNIPFSIQTSLNNNKNTCNATLDRRTSLEKIMEGNIHKHKGFEKNMEIKTEILTEKEKKMKNVKSAKTNFYFGYLSLNDFVFETLLSKNSMHQIFLASCKEKRFKKNLVLLTKIKNYKGVAFEDVVTLKNFCKNSEWMVKINEIFTNENFLFTIQDYFSRGTLQELILRKNGLNTQMTQNYAAQIIIALKCFEGKIEFLMMILFGLRSDNIYLDNQGNIMLNLLFIKLNSMVKSEENNRWLPPELLATNCNFDINSCLSWKVGILIFEMLFSNVDRKSTIPSFLNGSIAEFLNKSLIKNGNKRLKFSELMAEPFFEGVDWEALEKKKWDLTTPRIYNEEFIGEFESKCQSNFLEEITNFFT